MRKRILPRLRTLLSAAFATLYTRQSRPAMPKFSLEPKRNAIDAMEDAWLFASDEELNAVRVELSSRMDSIAESFSGLRETLALIHGETPFPIEATTRTPCAIVHHDDALFDGELDAPVIPAQEEISGGEGVFLFDDTPSFEDEATAHQHAA
ncbi:MAG: hypothetical protein VX599_00500 [Pseudomonadota bacterium]|nr:hypothetical protein [Pseudomonadota bacterium]